MLKVRVIPTLLLQDGLLKKPVQFKNPRTVANLVTVARVFEARQVDELVILDIGRTVDKEDVDPEIIKQVANELFMPFAYGGGINSIEQVKNIILAGAEKVVINTAAVKNPNLISEIAQKFGSQCVIVSIDAKKDENGDYKVYVKSGSEKTNLDVVEWAKEVEKAGAGEILINSIEHEGTMKGYDIDLIKIVSNVVNIPVIAIGGAGKSEDFSQAVLEGGASAVAAGSIFQFTPVTPDMVKKYLKDSGISVRIVNITDTADLYKSREL